MALSDLTAVHMKALDSAVMYLELARAAFTADDREQGYLNLAMTARNVDDVLAVIERPRDKPRNASPNGRRIASDA